MYLEVGQELMEEPVFDRLRTKEQLGYSVFCMLRNTFGILGLSITVNTQATKFSVDHVDTRIESFLEWFVNDKLAKITDEDFNDVIRTLIKQKSQADVTLSQEFCRNWAEIQSREYLFDRHLSDCKLLENCDKAAMIDFSTKLIDSKNVLRRKLSVQVVGNANVDEDALEDKPNDAIYDIQYKVDKERSNSNTELFIEDCTAYKATLTSYPVHKIIT
jgi:nardilysin